MVIYSMGAGGAERVLSLLSGYWVKQGYEISLLIFSENQDSVYELNPLVKIHSLVLHHESTGFMDSMMSNCRRLMTLRNGIVQSRPDVVLSFMTETSILCILALLGKKIPVIACEHSDPYQDPENSIWRLLRKVVFRFASHIVVLNGHAKSYFSTIGHKKVTVIQNPIEKSKAIPNPRSQIIAVGRLEKVKRYDRLLTAFSIVNKIHPDWSLTILGEGSERQNLELLVSQLNLSNSVSLPGWVKNPEEYLSTAGIYVLCSSYEGFPMALCEAMAAQVPSISVRYHSGIEDIMKNKDTGLIVDSSDVSALADAIATLIQDSALRKSISLQGKKSMQRFHWEAIEKKWDVVLSDNFRVEN